VRVPDQLRRSTRGRDQDIDVICRTFEQPQRGEVVPDRVSGIQIEHRSQNTGKHVARPELKAPS